MFFIHFLTRKMIPAGTHAADPAVRKRCGAASGLAGVGLNLLLCAGKFAAGAITGSISVMADAFNNLTDAAASAVTLVGFRMAGQKPDQDHPFGHGRVEYLAGVIISVLILVVGFELGKSSIEKIFRPEVVTMSVPAAMILAASAGVKLWLSFFNRALAQKLGSAALAAAAVDSLSDAVATTVVLIGLLSGQLGGVHIDGWLGAAVALFILRSGWGALKDTTDPLLGQPPEPELVKGVQDTVLSHHEVVGMHDLVIHDYGPGRRMLSLHAEVPAGADMLAAHDVIDHIERELRDKYSVDAVIHMDPVVMGDSATDQVRDLVARRAREIDPSITIHDFRMTRGPLHTNLIFDMVVPHSCKLTDEQAKARIARAMEREDGKYFTVVEVDRSYVL